MRNLERRAVQLLPGTCCQPDLLLAGAAVGVAHAAKYHGSHDDESENLYTRHDHLSLFFWVVLLTELWVRYNRVGEESL